MTDSRAEGASYAVLWQEPDEVTATGGLLLERDRLLLRGSSPDGRLAVRRLAYAEVTGVRIGRAPEEQLNGGPTVVLERGSRAPLRLAPFGPGLLHELADVLAQLSGEAADRLERIAVVAPLKKAAIARARELIEQGAPFDPKEAGLDRHDVFLTEQEVVFLFEGEQVSEAVRQLAGDPGLWRAALAWSACLAGRPRLAEVRYSWRSPNR